MYMFRETMYCKPGKVRDMVNRFKALSAAMQRLGYRPMRIFTDLGGERFWTVVSEIEADTLDAFMAMENKVMADEEARKAMSGYHELLESGTRQIFRVEA